MASKDVKPSDIPFPRIDDAEGSLFRVFQIMSERERHPDGDQMKLSDMGMEAVTLGLTYYTLGCATVLKMLTDNADKPFPETIVKLGRQVDAMREGTLHHLLTEPEE